jgi:hypothetical protein
MSEVPSKKSRLEDAACRCFVAPLLQRGIEFDAMFIDRAPQHIRLATEGDEYLVQMPGGAGLKSSRA